MKQASKTYLSQIKEDLTIYLNWSANALMPIHPGAADIYLKQNRSAILSVAQRLLKIIDYVPAPIYRGIILRQPVDSIKPHEQLQYLSFSDQRQVAEHFANSKGFGSEMMDVTAQLGNYGYVITYTPKISEVLFHWRFLSMLPYGEAFCLLGMDGQEEVNSLMKQHEIMILQPEEPFTNIAQK